MTNVKTCQHPYAQRRRALGLDRNGISLLAAVPIPHLGRIERGERPATPAEAARIEKVLESLELMARGAKQDVLQELLKVV